MDHKPYKMHALAFYWLTISHELWRRFICRLFFPNIFFPRIFYLWIFTFSSHTEYVKRESIVLFYFCRGFFFHGYFFLDSMKPIEQTKIVFSSTPLILIAYLPVLITLETTINFLQKEYKFLLHFNSNVDLNFVKISWQSMSLWLMRVMNLNLYFLFIECVFMVT